MGTEVFFFKMPLVTECSPPLLTDVTRRCPMGSEYDNWMTVECMQSIVVAAF